MDNVYYELTDNLYLKMDMYKKDSNEKTAKYINFAMEKDDLLKSIHLSKDKFKLYSFSTPYPTEVDGIYKANEIYKILIRSHDKEFIYRMKEVFNNLENQDFVSIGAEVKTYQYRKIDKLYNITPAVATITVDGKVISLTTNQGMEKIESAILNNIMRKYNYYNKTEFSFKQEDIFSYIKIKNDIPISMNYKSGIVLGYKYEIGLKDNPIAQEIGNFISVCGLLTKNSSLGCGFIKANYVR